MMCDYPAFTPPGWLPVWMGRISTGPSKWLVGMGEGYEAFGGRGPARVKNVLAPFLRRFLLIIFCFPSMFLIAKGGRAFYKALLLA